MKTITVDKNNIVEGLGAIRRFFGIGQPSQSFIFDSYQNIIDGTLSLLKEQNRLLHKKQRDINRLCAEIGQLKHKLHDTQEEVDPIKPLDKDDDFTYLCSKCKGELFCGDTTRDNYCPTCGRKVAWK